MTTDIHIDEAIQVFKDTVSNAKLLKSEIEILKVKLADSEKALAITQKQRNMNNTLIVPNYMADIRTNFKNILTNTLIKKLSTDMSNLIIKIRLWLSGEIPLSAMYVCIPIFPDSTCKLNVTDLIRHILVVSQAFENSHDINELQLSAQLKRLGQYLQGSIALKDV